MRTTLSLPLLGAAALTLGALLFHLSRKPEPVPHPVDDPFVADRLVATDSEADSKADFLARLRERGL